MTEVRVELRRKLIVQWSPEDAFVLVADVPRSAAYFPGLISVDLLEDGVYRWNLEALRVAKFTLPVGYTARYVSDEAQLTVHWTTVEGSGNTRADGSWTIEEHAQGAQLDFDSVLVVSLPIPRIAVKMASRAGRELAGRQFDTYLERIAASMGG